MSAVDPLWLRVLRVALWITYGVFWIGGVGGHLLYGGTPPEMGWTAPLFLLLASLLVVASAPREWKALIISFGAGFAAEAVGVATGFPFGAYSYTKLLSLSVLGVPLVVAGAWMILFAWVRQLRLPVWAGAVAMTLFDLVIDPLAANTLGYWTWKKPGLYYGVPLENFAGWFVVSLLTLATLRTRAPRSPAVFAVGASILIFFALLGVAHAFFVPIALGFLLCGAGYWGFISSKVSTRI